MTARELVTVRRHRDPLDGQTLPVLGRCRRGTQLLVVLPDGSKRVIPAAWTDQARGSGGAAVLASPGDLLGLCALPPAVIARLPEADVGEAVRVLAALIAKMAGPPVPAPGKGAGDE